MPLNYRKQLKELPPGYTFQPSDQELIGYVKRHVEGVPPDVIPVANVYDVEPGDLHGAKTVEGDWKCLYFLTKRKKRGIRVNRQAGNGSWKVLKKNTTVEDSQGNPIGLKGYLVYKSCKPSASEKNWYMNEYQLFPQQQSSGDEEWVVCKIVRSKWRSNSGKDASDKKDIDEAEEMATTSTEDDWQSWLNKDETLPGVESVPWYNNQPSPTDQYESMSDFFSPQVPIDTMGSIDGYSNGNGFYSTSSPLLPPPSGSSMDWCFQQEKPWEFY
ncbi:hypothetical protein ACLOJK_022059 [Asimina triloba]